MENRFLNEANEVLEGLSADQGAVEIDMGVYVDDERFGSPFIRIDNDKDGCGKTLSDGTMESCHIEVDPSSYADIEHVDTADNCTAEEFIVGRLFKEFMAAFNVQSGAPAATKWDFYGPGACGAYIGICDDLKKIIEISCNKKWYADLTEEDDYDYMFDNLPFSKHADLIFQQGFSSIKMMFFGKDIYVKGQRIEPWSPSEESVPFTVGDEKLFQDGVHIENLSPGIFSGSRYFGDIIDKYKEHGIIDPDETGYVLCHEEDMVVLVFSEIAVVVENVKE